MTPHLVLKSERSRESMKGRGKIRNIEHTAVTDVETDVEHWLKEETKKKRNRKRKAVGAKF